MLLHIVTIVSLSLTRVHAISPSAVALNKQASSVPAASTDNGGLSTEGVATLDGLSLDAIAEGRSAESTVSASIPKTNWVATADSYQPGFPPSNVLDTNLDTFWHTTYTPGLPPSAMSGVSNFSSNLPRRIHPSPSRRQIQYPSRRIFRISYER